MDYHTSLPRAAFAIIAVAMTAITIALTVVVPAKVDSATDPARVLAVPAAATRAITPVVVTSARVDIATRPVPASKSEVVVAASRLPTLGATLPNATNN